MTHHQYAGQDSQQAILTTSNSDNKQFGQFQSTSNSDNKQFGQFQSTSNSGESKYGKWADCTFWKYKVPCRWKTKLVKRLSKKSTDPFFFCHMQEIENKTKRTRSRHNVSSRSISSTHLVTHLRSTAKKHWLTRIVRTSHLKASGGWPLYKVTRVFWN